MKKWMSKFLIAAAGATDDGHRQWEWLPLDKAPVNTRDFESLQRGPNCSPTTA